MRRRQSLLLAVGCCCCCPRCCHLQLPGRSGIVPCMYADARIPPPPAGRSRPSTPPGDDEDCSMAKVLLTGAAGGVGRAARSVLEAAGGTVVPIDLTCGDDLRDETAVLGAMVGCAAVVHAGAVAHDSSGGDLLDANSGQESRWWSLPRPEVWRRRSVSFGGVVVAARARSSPSSEPGLLVLVSRASGRMRWRGCRQGRRSRRASHTGCRCARGRSPPARPRLQR